MPASTDSPREPDAARSLGELQAQLMPVLWRLGLGTVEDVRKALPPRYRGAYTTVQTVLNRLAERGLLTRGRRGQAILYRPAITEAEYVSRAVESTLAGASSEVRRTVLAQLVGGLDSGELSELQRLAQEIDARRSAAEQ
jgi:predicted transcriptional regulator